MAPGRRRPWLSCFCSCVVLMFLLLLANYGAVVPETSEPVGSGRSVRAVDVPEVGSYDNFQGFERRELANTDYPNDPADPNCDNDPSLCTP